MRQVLIKQMSEMMTDKAQGDQLPTDGPIPLGRLGRVFGAIAKKLILQRHRRLADVDLENLPNSVKRDMGWPDRHLFKTKIR